MQNPKRVLSLGVLLIGIAIGTIASLTGCTGVSSTSAIATSTEAVTPTHIPTSPGKPASPPPSPSPSTSATPRPSSPPAHLPRVRLSRGPYLQSVAADRITIVWETDHPSSGEVVYGETERYNLRASDTVIGTGHAVTLTDLAPYTIYHYRVQSNAEILGNDGTFRTAASPEQTSFTFVVFGDTRTQHRIHRTVVERIAAIRPDFVIHTGDLVGEGGDPRQWDAFFDIERQLLSRTPFFPTLGNHEGNHANYFDLFHLPGNERWYTFDYGNARFICLQVDGFANFDPRSEQYGWLETTLAANTQPWLIVYFHIPPYSSVKHSVAVRQTLAPLFEQYGVDVVFNGHAHSYERNETNGITYIVTAGGGAPLYWMETQEPTMAAFARAYHFVLLETAGDHLKGRAISITGELLDKFERIAN